MTRQESRKKRIAVAAATIGAYFALTIFSELGFDPVSWSASDRFFWLLLLMLSIGLAIATSEMLDENR